MLFVPLPFVVATLLFALFAVVAKRDREDTNVPFLVLILLNAFQSVFLGLRWGYGVQDIGYVMPLVASIVPPLAYAGVARLVRREQPSWLRAIPHAAPAGIVAIMLVIWRSGIDVALIIVFLGYSIAILRLMRPGTDALRLVPFENTTAALHAIILAAAALVLSAAIDTFVLLDVIAARGTHSAEVLMIGNLGVLVVLSFASATAGRSQVLVDGPETAHQTCATDNTLAIIQSLMREKRTYRDVALTLDRLARKTGIPARQISNAINRETGKNVSQYVNEFRIAEACELLTTTENSVTEIMLSVGFQTKSNFNREFRRVTGMTPLSWRAKPGKRCTAER